MSQTRTENIKEFLQKIKSANAQDERNQRLARLSEQAHTGVKEFLKTVEPMNLGRLRLEVKKHLANEMTAIDRTVGEMLA